MTPEKLDKANAVNEMIAHLEERLKKTNRTIDLVNGIDNTVIEFTSNNNYVRASDSRRGAYEHVKIEMPRAMLLEDLEIIKRGIQRSIEQQRAIFISL